MYININNYFILIISYKTHLLISLKTIYIINMLYFYKESTVRRSMKIKSHLSVQLTSLFFLI
jgi:hypothetical protein